MRQDGRDLAEALHLLFDAATNVRRAVSEDVEEKAGIPRHWFEALERTRLHPPMQPWHVTELAVEMALPQSTTTRLLDQLEQAGLVRRVADPANRRATLIEVTELGHQTADDGREVFEASLREHLASPLTDDQLERLAGITRILRDSNA